MSRDGEEDANGILRPLHTAVCTRFNDTHVRIRARTVAAYTRPARGRVRVLERLTAGRNPYVPAGNTCNILPPCISLYRSRVYVESGSVAIVARVRTSERRTAFLPFPQIVTRLSFSLFSLGRGYWTSAVGVKVNLLCLARLDAGSLRSLIYRRGTISDDYRARGRLAR